MLKTLVNRYWPLVVSFVVFVSFNIPAIIAQFDEDVNADFSWRSLLLFLSAIITMFRVWSKDQALKLAGSMPDAEVIERVNANKSV